MIDIRHTSPADLETVMSIYDHAKIMMRKSGNMKQWSDNYPSQDVILRDIDTGNSYVIESDRNVIGVFTFAKGEEPNYAVIDGQWPDNRPYGTIHRLAAAPGHKGIADIALHFCCRTGINIRIDTHADNVPMLGWIASRGFSYCGIIYVEDGSPRKAFHLENPKIEMIDSNKMRYLDLLLIGDEQQDMIERYIDLCQLYIAFEADEPVACIAACEVSQGLVEIKNLAVRADRRKRGIGRRMLKHVESQYPAHAIQLGTGETPSTLEFYKRCGYTFSHRIPGFFTENYRQPIIEEGITLKDMLYLRKPPLNEIPTPHH